jgi:hypothetical protein
VRALCRLPRRPKSKGIKLVAAAKTYRRWSATLGVVLAVVASSLIQSPHAEAAKARPKCLGKRATIVGNKKANTLKGTKKADVIVGLGGSDRLIGGGGADRICGGPGKDRIYGGLGNDRLDGGKGRDECRQEAGKGKKKNCEGPKLQLAVAKTGAGTVTSAPSGIDCGGTCAHDFMEGLSVVLTASAASGSTFTGWGGACSASSSCAVPMTKAQSVSATFAAAAPPPAPPPPPTFTLTVTTDGSGSGSVSSSPAGVSCGADCTESYQQGTAVTLSASPTGGSLFAGWGGVCSGTGNCIVYMDAAKSLSATFQLARTLTVNKAGAGSGTRHKQPSWRQLRNRLQRGLRRRLLCHPYGGCERGLNIWWVEWLRRFLGRSVHGSNDR